MTDRDRLIELLMDFSKPDNPITQMAERRIIERIADYLLANGVIVPPCKVGDKVWWATTSVDENCEEIPTIEIGEVVSFSLQKEGLWAYCRYESGLTYWHLVVDYFGKTVFLTKEETEEKLRELKDNGI